MSLLNKSNKRQTIHLCDVLVQAIARQKATAINLMIKEDTKFIQNNLIRVLSDQEYAIRHLADIWQKATHEEGTDHKFLIDYVDPRDNPQDNKICFYFMEDHGRGIYRYLVMVTINNMEKETFEKFVEYICSKNGLIR